MAEKAVKMIYYSSEFHFGAQDRILRGERLQILLLASLVTMFEIEDKEFQ